MAFPADRLPVTVEIAPGGDPAADPGTWTWVDITSSVRLRDRIHITQGRADRSARVAPATCRLRLDNRTGNFTPRNPLGTWYGTLGRNTPLRVRITMDGTTATDNFSRTVANGWGTATTGQVWTTSGGVAADYSTNGTQGLHSVGAVASTRRTLLAVSLTDAEASIQVKTQAGVFPTGARFEAGLLLRFIDANNYYAAHLFFNPGGTMSVRLLKRVAGTATTLSTVVVAGLTHSSDTFYTLKTQVLAGQLKVKAWRSIDPEPYGWHATAADSSLTAAGQLSVESLLATGNTNTLPVVLPYDTLSVAPPTVDRFSGFVSSWPPRWDKSGRDATVPIEANGVLRRLGQGTPPSHSPMRRSVMSPEHTGLLAYWPCEDSKHSTQAASAIPARPAMTVSGTVEFASVDAAAALPEPFRLGTAALPDLKGGGSLRGAVPPGTSSPVQWAVLFWANANTSTSVLLAEWDTPGGTYVRWAIQQTQPAGNTELIAYNSAGSPTTVLTDVGWFGVSPGGHRVDAIQNGANVDVRLWTGGDVDASTTLAGNTLARITTFAANPGAVTDTDTIGIGHVMVWDDEAAPQFENLITAFSEMATSAWNSYWGETFDVRLARLCAEEGVSLSMPAVSAGFAVQMGAQPTGTFLDLLDQCAVADQGVLYEQGFGLGYLPREARYNRAVSLALDFDAGQIAEAPEPTDDDYGKVNRVEVTRILGSSVVAEDTDSIAAIGLYPDSAQVNLADDAALADHAAWRLHLGT